MRKTLYEGLIKSPPPIAPEIIGLLPESEIFFIDNVAEYSSFGEIDLFKDCPNIAPPFPYIFMEFRSPLTSPVGNAVKYGAFLSYFESNKDMANWEVFIHVFAQLRDRTIGSPFVNHIFIDGNGVVVGVDQWKYKTLRDGGKGLDTARKLTDSISLIALLAISFLHCKNVTRVPHGSHLGSKAKRERHAPHIRYHTLVIEPMKKILREEGQSEKTGLKMALHICRGHFKDFREGKGLFGKFKDIYWWDSQVRGSLSEGIVTKDYQVDAPVV
jgi:hypothetical protein